MAPSAKKRKAAELDGDLDPKQLANGARSPSADGQALETPPPIGLDTTEVPFKLQCPAVQPKKKGKAVVKVDIFGPQAEDGGYPQLETLYTIRPGSKWSDLKPYRNFIVADNKFSLGSHVYISHPNSPKNPNDYKFVASDEKTEPDFWVAKVLEVRASDQQHVYLRVFWLYWPDELPGGRQPYHGQNEVVMSNHMDIIDAMTVSNAADVRIWYERDEDEELPSLFFRQFYNVSAKAPLSELRRHCICNQYYNPDTTLLKCNNPSCGIWLHERCLLDDILQKLYERRIVDGGKVEKDEIPLKKESTPLDTPKAGILSTAGHLGDMLAHPLRTIKASMSPAPEAIAELRSETAAVRDTSLASGLSGAPATPNINGKGTPKGAQSTPKSRSKPKGRGKAHAANGERGTEEKEESDLEKAKEIFSVKIESSELSAEEKENGAVNAVQVLIKDLRPGAVPQEWKEDLSCLKCGSRLD